MDTAARNKTAARRSAGVNADALRYQSGFGGEFATEALPGALPQGSLQLATELGRLEVKPGEIALIPRGMRFQVELEAAAARGYVCENYGAHFRLPELGPIGANGLANARDFLAPVAAFEDREGDFELVAKFAGALWSASIDHSPLDVVAWHGNHVPYKYDLARFNKIGRAHV